MTQLEQHHYDHLISEGFTPEHIAKLERMGVVSLSQVQAFKAKFTSWNGKQNVCSAGLYFPFTDTFGQIRCDIPIKGIKGKPRKYLTPKDTSTKGFVPRGCQVITEGFKDAMAGTFHGDIATGAVAGVSHIAKAFPKQSIKDYFPDGPPVILFDSDGWVNPSVMASLLQGALHLGSKIQLVPPIEGEPKGGLCEYFKVGYTAADYAELVANAYRPEELIVEWAKRWETLSTRDKGRALKIAITYTQMMGVAA